MEYCKIEKIAVLRFLKGFHILPQNIFHRAEFDHCFTLLHEFLELSSSAFDGKNPESSLVTSQLGLGK